MSIVHEPIHGDIKLSELAEKIIDHPYFDRTHYKLRSRSFDSPNRDCTGRTSWGSPNAVCFCDYDSGVEFIFDPDRLSNQSHGLKRWWVSAIGLHQVGISTDHNCCRDLFVYDSTCMAAELSPHLLYNDLSNRTDNLS